MSCTDAEIGSVICQLSLESADHSPVPPFVAPILGKPLLNSTIWELIFPGVVPPVYLKWDNEKFAPSAARTKLII